MISHRRGVALLSLVVVSHATFACSRSDNTSSASVEAGGAAPARTASCDRVTAMSVCSEYAGGYLAQNEAVLSSACVKLAGAFVGAECPNTAVLGSCTLATGEVRKFYASGGSPFDVGRAETECTGPYKGKWTAFK